MTDDIDERTKRMRKALTAAGLGLVLVLTGCGSAGSGGPIESDAGFELETEDCDYEDALNAERECSERQIRAAMLLKAKRDAAKKKSSTSTKTGTSTKTTTKTGTRKK